MEDYRRAEEYQKKKEAADMKRERDDIQRRKDEAMRTKRYLDYQQDLKRQTKQVDDAIEQEYARRFREEGEQAQRDKVTEAMELRRKHKEYEKMLTI